MSLQHQFSCRLIAGGQDFDQWAGLSGRGVSSESIPDYPGGMAPARILTGPAEREDATLTRTYTDTIQAQNARRELDRLVRRGADATVIELDMDADKNVVGPGFAFPGRLKSIAPPERSASSTTDLATITVVVALKEEPA